MLTTTASRVVAATLAGGTLLMGCAAQHSDGRAANTKEKIPHGYVEGAEEMPEPQPRLVLADGETGRVHVLDLLTGETSAVAHVEGVRDIAGNGRYAYLTTGSGVLRVIDGGAWAVDHGDHFHYYRTAARDLGEVAGRPPYETAEGAAVTAVRSADGAVELFDRARMEKGDLAGTGGLRAAAAVPYQEHLLMAADGAVVARARTGGAGTPVGACEDPAGTAVTRRGVIFGCADGALLVTRKGGAFAGERIRYPRTGKDGERATEFLHRPGSTTLAAKAGDSGTWVLDVAAKRWKLLETGPVVAVNAVGEDAPVLSLTEDGVLHAYDPVSGDETARTELLTAPLTGSPSIQVDTGRAYLNDPAARAVHEIDYNDDLRRARTFETGFTPTYMTETGR
ncbi:ABC transporter [Nonomuraea sp. bgisy101]|uniref:ABC transporter n=1 Tax=Nonomuraea sp. bgisy101 TaxID=3413784 RepID=UPI003D757355